MDFLWSFLAKPKNREMLSWLGGGVAAIAAGAFAVATYLWPAQQPAKTVCAQHGISIGGNVASSTTISNTVTSAPMNAAPCSEIKQ